jgi:hypothetical protein
MNSQSVLYGGTQMHAEAAAANAWIVKHLKSAPVRVKRAVLEALRAFHMGESSSAVAARLPQEWDSDIRKGVMVIIEKTTVGMGRR